MRLVVHTDLLHTPCFPYEQEAWIELLQQVAVMRSNVEVLLLQKRDIVNPSDVRVMQVPVALPVRHPFFWKIFYQTRLRLLLHRLQPAVFISLSATKLPYSRMAQALFVPDGTCSAAIIQQHFHGAVRHAVGGHVNIVSAVPLHVQAATLQLQAPFLPAAFTPLSYDAKEAVKHQYTQGAEYFLYMGPLCKQANLLHLLRAFSQFKKWQTSSMKLVLCGPDVWSRKGFTDLLARYKHRNDVIVTGKIPLTDAAQLTAGAYALIQPFAGSGAALSALAAMQAAVPAIVMRTSANEAAGGSSFLYTENAGIQELAAKMMLLYKDETLRSQLIRNGKQHTSAAATHPAVQQLLTLLDASVAK